MGRLMKYDLRAAMKLFLPIWIGTLILSLVNSFTIFRPEDASGWLAEFLTSLTMIAYVLAVIAIVIITIIYIVLRFYQGLLKDEGYLTFTLPVGIDSILWAKALTGLILLAVSGVVCVLSVLILTRTYIDMRDVELVVSMFVDHASTKDLILSILSAVMFAIGTCLSGIFHAYLAMAFGQLAKKRKLGASVLAYVLISTVTSAVASMVLMPLSAKLFSGLGRPNVLSIFNGPQGMWLILFLGTLYNLLFTAIYYFPTRYIFKNKLNLE